ncbi:MAG: hypothetical protein IJX58_02190, partial [Clostridia bacterium]|nr:hypothetical protein [Clostridia bacterium]
DGVHPNTKGYQMFVKIIEKALLEGDEALTEEFINQINEEYEAKVPNAYVTLDSVVIDNMTLTIKGMSNDKGIQLFVGQKPEHSSAYYPIVLADDGSFEIAFDLRTLAIGSDWYNVRIYFTDGNYYTVSLNDAKNAAGESLALWSWIILENTQIQICSWNEGDIPTLSFKVEEYVKPSFETVITGGSIAEKDGQIILTVTGTTTDPNAVLVVGPKDDVSLYGHALDIAEDGSFTATLDLTTLEISSEWQNASIIMSDGKSKVISYETVGVKVDDVLYSSEAKKKIVVHTWGGEKILSLSVEYYDDSYTLTATDVKFENGKLVFSGTTTNVRTLTAYLYNTTEGITDYKADAVLADDGSFTVEIALDQLTMAAGNWYYLWTSVNGGDLTKVVYENYDKSEYYGYGFRTYKWEYWEGIAVNYSNFEYGVTHASITEVDGKAILTIEGIMKDAAIAADTIKLRLDKTKGTKEVIDIDNLAAEAGHFKFVYDVSNLINSAVSTQYSEEAYFIRLFVNGSKKADLNSRWAAADLFENVIIGNGKYYFMKNGSSSWNTLGIARFEHDPGVEEEEVYDYYLVGGQISASNMPFTLTQENDRIYISFEGT